MLSRTSRRGARALLAAGCVAALTAGTAVVATPAAASAETRFIITVAEQHDSRAVAAEHRRKGAEIEYVYSHALNGFAGSMSEAELGELQRDRRVTRIERDGAVRATTSQGGATWGLDRIDDAAGLDGSYTYTATAATATAYIIDTGIRKSHAEFGTRVQGGYTAIDDGNGTEDCNGHGTHVAGTVGGTAYGVAKAVQLVPVRVLDCGGSGTWAGVIAGIDWVAGNAAMPAVANMSLGGGGNSSVDDAVNRAIKAGVTVVVAAGNGNQGGKEQDACGYSPARVPAAVTIGATTKEDVKTSWSNYGSCVDFFAPGAGITSAWYTSDTAINTISGTSMAAPHVAGVAALYLGENPHALPQAVRDELYNATTKNIVTSSKTANNHLLYSPFAEATVPTNGAPTAGFTYECTDLSCSFTDTSQDDAGITSWSWTFGDTATSSSQHPQHTYKAAGSYTVTLQVADAGGLTSTASRSVTVGAASTSISLSVRGYKVKGQQKADLSWSGPSTVVVSRTGTSDRTVTGGGTGPFTWTDAIDNNGGGSYTYTVCDAADLKRCSNSVTITF